METKEVAKWSNILRKDPFNLKATVYLALEYAHKVLDISLTIAVVPIDFPAKGSGGRRLLRSCSYRSQSALPSSSPIHVLSGPPPSLLQRAEE